MSKFLIDFVEGAKFSSRLSGLLNWISSAGPKMRVIHPIEAFDCQNGKGISIRSNGKIRANEEIILVSTMKSITSFELVDCNPTRAYDIDNISDIIGKKHNLSNDSQFYFAVSWMKLMMQIFVQSKDSSLSLAPYASFLLSGELRDPLHWSPAILKQVYSPNLIKLIKSTGIYYQSIREDLEKNNIFGPSVSEIAKISSIIRSRVCNFTPETPKLFTNDYIGIMCPVIDLVNHSFTPNCKLEGKYHVHEAESFVVLKAVKEIEPGMELTINYGNLGNHDLLMKYGFVAKDNPFSELSIELSFDEYLGHTQEQFSLKQKIFKTFPDLQMETLTLFKNKINEDILRMLRIYFLTDKDIFSKPEIASYMWKDFSKVINKRNENLVCDFMIKNTERNIQIYLKNKEKNAQVKLEDKDYDTMLQFCEEEINILRVNQGYFVKRLAEFQD